MDISLNSPVSKKNGLPPVPGLLPGAERREAERSEADQSGAAGKNGGRLDPEVVPDAKRRRFTTEYKLRILTEADAAKNSPGAVGALLRREGLYSSHLVTWRRERDAAVAEALTPKKRGPKTKQDPQQAELARLQRENARLHDELDKARLIIEVQKKVALLLGRELPRTDHEEKS
jgi:transposase-like protein